MNGFLYQYVALAMQASQVYNVTIPGGRKYNVPSGNITFDDSIEADYPNQFSYSTEAIAGADDFMDGNTTVRDIFDLIVENTREVTPTCAFFTTRPYLFILLTCLQSRRNHLDTWVRTQRSASKQYVLTIIPSGTIRMDGPSVRLSSFPRTALSSSSIRFLSSETPSVHSTLRLPIF